MFSRLTNIFRGFLSVFFSNIEAANPEIVYEQAIETTKANYLKARNAVAGIVAERERTNKRAEKIKRELDQARSDLDASLNTDDDELSATLIQKVKQLEAQQATAIAELTAISEQAEKAKTDLMAVQARIDELQREREANLARYHSAKARQHLQEQLTGLSTAADVKALDNVRNAIDKQVATVSLNEEMAGTEIDRKLANLRQTSGASAAKSEVAALKAARRAAQTEGGGGKSM